MSSSKVWSRHQCLISAAASCPRPTAISASARAMAPCGVVGAAPANQATTCCGRQVGRAERLLRHQLAPGEPGPTGEVPLGLLQLVERQRLAVGVDRRPEHDLPRHRVGDLHRFGLCCAHLAAARKADRRRQRLQVGARQPGRRCVLRQPGGSGRLSAVLALRRRRAGDRGRLGGGPNGCGAVRRSPCGRSDDARRLSAGWDWRRRGGGRLRGRHGLRRGWLRRRRDRLRRQGLDRPRRRIERRDRLGLGDDGAEQRPSEEMNSARRIDEDNGFPLLRPGLRPVAARAPAAILSGESVAATLVASIHGILRTS